MRILDREGADQLSETRLLASFDRLAVTMSLKVKQIKASIRINPSSVSSSEKRYYIFQLVDEKVFYIAHLITVISSNRRARDTFNTEVNL